MELIEELLKQILAELKEIKEKIEFRQFKVDSLTDEVTKKITDNLDELQRSVI